VTTPNGPMSPARITAGLALVLEGPDAESVCGVRESVQGRARVPSAEWWRWRATVWIVATAFAAGLTPGR